MDKHNAAGIDIMHPLVIKLNPLQARLCNGKHVFGDRDTEALAVVDAIGIDHFELEDLGIGLHVHPVATLRH